jgi:hypothetical protein
VSAPSLGSGHEIKQAAQWRLVPGSGRARRSNVVFYSITSSALARIVEGTEVEPFSGFEVDDHSVRLKPGRGKEDVAFGNLSMRSRGFDSLPVKVSQPAGSESCMGGGNTAREA